VGTIVAVLGINHFLVTAINLDNFPPPLNIAQHDPTYTNNFKALLLNIVPDNRKTSRIKLSTCARMLPALNVVFMSLTVHYEHAHLYLGKKSWWGCGKHIPTIMDVIPEQDRCTCEPKVEVNGNKYPPKAAHADE